MAEVKSALYGIEDLIYLMARLRDPNTGCPWDLKQTFQTIVPYTLEETYEVADAIASGDMAHIKEELGDLLFQIIFYSQMGSEKAEFTFNDVVHGITEKLVRRHPHVFADGTLRGQQRQDLTEEQIKANWEKIKQQEKAAKNPQADEFKSLLADVPKAMPALMRAEKLQKKAATVGFDWPQASQVLDKIEEEIGELREAIAAGREAEIQDEMGDLMFACVNLARHLNVKSEVALDSTNRKFSRRFEYIERNFAAQGRDMAAADLNEMEAKWQEAKQYEKQ